MSYYSMAESLPDRFAALQKRNAELEEENAALRRRNEKLGRVAEMAYMMRKALAIDSLKDVLAAEEALDAALSDLDKEDEGHGQDPG